MVIYSVGILPLIRCLNQLTVSQVSYADDAAAIGQLQHLRQWCNELVSTGSDFGHFANPSKSWLLVKPTVLDTAKSLFADTSTNITSDGCRYLGSPIGSKEFTLNFISNTVTEWINQLDRLTSIAQTQPHATYAVITHGFLSKFTYLFRTTPDVSKFVEPLENILHVN